MDQVLRRHDVSSSGEHTQRGLDDREVHDDPPIMQDPPLSARGEACLHSVFSAQSSPDRHYEAISRSAVGSGIRGMCSHVDWLIWRLIPLLQCARIA